jgi:hypothetical protein
MEESHLMFTRFIQRLHKAKSRILTEIMILFSGVKVWRKIKRIKSLHLTYLSERRLLQIARTIKHIRSSQIQGDFIEVGCALGGSSILIASLKDKERFLKIYDVFGQIPAPGPLDGQDARDRYEVIVDGNAKGLGLDRYYGYRNDLRTIVEFNLNSFRIDLKGDSVFLIEGLLQNTLRPTQAIAFAHIDVDWFEPVSFSLEKIFPKLAIGGSVIIDDYFDWDGCRVAVDLFLDNVDAYIELDSSCGSLKITKTA